MRPRWINLALAAEPFRRGTPRPYHSRARIEPVDRGDLERLAVLIEGRGHPREGRMNELGSEHKAIIVTFDPCETGTWWRAFERIELRCRRLAYGIPLKSLTVQVSTEPLPTDGEGLGGTT